MKRKIEEQSKAMNEMHKQSQRQLLKLQTLQGSGGSALDLLASPLPPVELPPQPAEAGSEPHKTLSPNLIVTALQRFQEQKIIESQQDELSALKARMKEVRLNMQRQINDLQEQLGLVKEQQQAELARLRLEYGRDLSALHRSHLLKEEETRALFEEDSNQRVRAIEEDHGRVIQELNLEFEGRIEQERKDREREEIIRREYEKELNKLKKRSNANAQGGWGTFSIVFEDNPKKHHPLILGGQAPASSTPSTVSSSSQSSGTHRRGSVTDVAAHLGGETGVAGHDKTVLTNEQLAHFIEVGFLLDQKNFKHLESYQEHTFDSTVTKHLFEFQEPMDAFKAASLQTRLRTQLYENYALFSEINPVYISFNLGRNVSPFWDESLPQEQFRLLKREALFLAGEHYLTVNFLRCDEPALVLRVVAFDNDSCTAYSFDLTYEDLMLFADGNHRLLDADNYNDLCQMIMNNLTKFTSKENLFDAPAAAEGSDNEEEGGGGFDGDEPERTLETRYSKLLTQKDGEAAAGGGFNQGPHAEITLAVEHKIFFNEAYRNEYERNKLIIAKNDKRKKGMLQDKSLATEYEKSIVYEAQDAIFEETLALTTHSSVATSAALCLLKGRMSEHLVLRVTISCAKFEAEAVQLRRDSQELSVGTTTEERAAVVVFSQDLCLYQSEVTKQQLAQQVASIIVKVPEEAQALLDRVLAYALSIEKIFNSNNLVIRVTELKR